MTYLNMLIICHYWCKPTPELLRMNIKKGQKQPFSLTLSMGLKYLNTLAVFLHRAEAFSHRVCLSTNT